LSYGWSTTKCRQQERIMRDHSDLRGYGLTDTAAVLICLTGLILLPFTGSAASTQDWQVVRSSHFLVMHTGNEAMAGSVSEKAEAYYTTIAADLGYTRYQNFWVWDNRVKILIYPTVQAFATACQAPAWAVGRANYERHEIASYRQSGEGFLSVLLPHELSHLILSDCIGTTHVPLWLTEGFAQWEQEGRKTNAPTRENWLKISALVTADIRQDTDRDRVALFYVQSASLVGYMIKSYGGEAFGNFCKALRDGKTVNSALATTYPGDIPSLDTLEQKWLNSIRR